MIFGLAEFTRTTEHAAKLKLNAQKWLRSIASRTCVVTRTYRRQRRQSVLGCWTRTVEQSSIAPERRWLIVQWIPAVAKDISVWTVGLRRSV